ncbi:hypothetical protein PMIN02_012367 [Paraphaeosphaeria minitans]|uniref:Secreted protein n=1 Tax=Paraphaeosphaeria minitans TaxID=565426 RepID=A0A9P6GPU5_9PLEO|nr:hypothetical protein PMIN01_01637 [Paraphaeosphaeria minitans]
MSSSLLSFFFAAAMVATAFFISAKLAPAVHAICTSHLLRDSDPSTKLHGSKLLAAFASTLTNGTNLLSENSNWEDPRFLAPTPERTAATTLVPASASQDDEDTHLNNDTSVPHSATLPISRTESGEARRAAAHSLLRRTGAGAGVLRARVPGIVQVPTGGYNCAVM